LKPLGDFIAEHAEKAIEKRTFLIPIFRTYSKREFAIGDVAFRPITKQLLDTWFPNSPLPDPEMDRRVRSLENDTRAKYQATMAACIEITAEETKASQIALEKAQNSIALVRFLSVANWTSKVKSYALPHGMENALSWSSFHLNEGKVTGLSTSSILEGRHEWAVDEMTALYPNLISDLSDIASTQETEFRKALFDSFLLYSRNSTTTQPSDKLVFILVALESILLKDASEPIQGNLAERMAFLIGPTLDDRKAIVSDVKKTYGMRSKFIHHGQGMDDLLVYDRFLMHAWSTMYRLLQLRNSYKTRQDLINALDELKLS
jgi:hypothetical protein